MIWSRRKAVRKNSARQLITQMNPRSPISEQYRTLRTNLDFTAIDSKLESILITSSNPEEGKSITAANLAVVYAQQGKKVLLVDADLRKPTVHYIFQCDHLRGLTNVLVGDVSEDEVYQVTGVENLDVITSGPTPPNPSELLGSKRMERFLKMVKEKYDIIIIDSPPVLAVTDAQVLANIVDGTLLVVRSEQTEQEEAIQAKESLLAAHANLLGVVLNGHDKKNTNYYYYG